MFKSIYITDPYAPFAHRERQLVAKYGVDDCGLVYAVVEYNDYEIAESIVGFNDYEDERANLADAADYVAAFNKAWVMVEQTVEALSVG